MNKMEVKTTATARCLSPDELTFWEVCFCARVGSAVLAAGLALRVVADAIEIADLAVQARRDAIQAWRTR